LLGAGEGGEGREEDEGADGGAEGEGEGAEASGGGVRAEDWGQGGEEGRLERSDIERKARMVLLRGRFVMFNHGSEHCG
jgi:hypothetical protein